MLARQCCWGLLSLFLCFWLGQGQGQKWAFDLKLKGRLPTQNVLCM